MHLTGLVKPMSRGLDYAGHGSAAKGPLVTSDIQFEDTSQGGRFYIPGQTDGREAELIFVRRGTIWDAVSTFVPPSQRGQGIAAKLVDRLIADARAQGAKVLPTCPYIKVKFDRHKDWSDVLAKQ